MILPDSQVLSGLEMTAGGGGTHTRPGHYPHTGHDSLWGCDLACVGRGPPGSGVSRCRLDKENVSVPAARTLPFLCASPAPCKEYTS